MNKTVLITGASRGIGKEIALTMAEEGYSLVLLCKTNLENLKEIAEETKKYGISCEILQADVGDPSIIEQLSEFLETNQIQIDILIHNAAISHIGLMQDMSPMQWENVIQTNLSSMFYLSKAVVPQMVSRKEGKIIAISSVWGICGASCETAYSAAKGGLNAFVKALAKELAPSNIQVNALACGAVDTSMNQFLSEEEKKELCEQIPYGRMASPKEVAQTIRLLSDSCNYLTGQIVAFDGGWI